jgi:hypothetical protein
MPRWTAAQILSGFALEKPLKLKEWRGDMDGKILPAQLKLREAIIQGWIIDVWGRRGPPGSKERMPNDLFSDPEFTLLVTLHGALTVHPPHRRQKFEAKYGIDLDNWWREIDFDRDEGERVLAVSLAPCQRQPDRPHLRLVAGARSDETEAPAARAEELTPGPAPAVGPDLPRVESVPPPESAPAANAEDQGEAAATTAETAGRPPASTPAGDASAPAANTEVPVAEPEPAARAKQLTSEPVPPVKSELAQPTEPPRLAANTEASVTEPKATSSPPLDAMTTEPTQQILRRMSRTEQAQWLKTTLADNPPGEDEPLTSEGYGKRIADMGAPLGAMYEPSTVITRYYQLNPLAPHRRKPPK